MSRANIPLLAFQRGIISPKSLARVDLDRTRLSAEVMTNWLPKTVGPMSLRPGTQYKGSSFHDTGAEFVEFIASADDLALLELTNDTGSGLGTLRSWQGTDAHALSLLGRPPVDTTVSLSDTGWSNASSGGNLQGASATDLIPDMTAETTNGVQLTDSTSSGTAWRGADDDVSTIWSPGTGVPVWLNVDFGSANAVGSYTLRAGPLGSQAGNMAQNWRLIGSNFDTGTFATDTGKWTLENEQTSQTGWAVSEKRTYPISDTGTPGPHRHWRLYVTALNGDDAAAVSELELLLDTGSTSVSQAQFSNGTLILNPTSIGALAKVTKRVIVSDTGTEHSLDIHVTRGPVVMRVGSTSGDDDYIAETSLGTGYHNLAFTPAGNFHVTVQNADAVDRIVSSLRIGDSGTVEVRTPWTAGNLDNIRYDQSADVVYVDCLDVRPQKIERRGTGRSWSVVDYAPDDGPFLTSPSSSAKLSVSHFYGNTTLNSDIPLFRSSHVGSLVRMFHEGQGGKWALGALDAKTDAIEITGFNDTGTGAGNERQATISVSGSWSGTLVVERSFDGPDRGYNPAQANFLGGSSATDTGTFSRTLRDEDDNISVHYRVRMTNYTSGAAIVSITYGGGGITGIARITGYNSNTDVDIEVLSRFSDTGMTDNWQFGHWSEARGFPTAVQLHGGRLAHAQGGSMFLSASDDFESFDVNIEGDAAPIIRTIGSGPVDRIHYLVSVLRLLIGTAGSELTVKSSSLDEPLTPDNSSVIPFSTQGSANLRAVKLDTRAIMVQRSRKRVLQLGPAETTLADYQSFDLTLLVPDLLAAGVVSIAVQRQPDTRLHCVLADGTAGILTFEPDEEVIAWHTFVGDTGTSPQVERAMVLPGVDEDAVYYHIKRNISGTSRRYLEKWSKESECLNDSGLSWLMDCAVSFSGIGRANSFSDVATHLAGESVVAWGDLDSGSTPYVDLSPGFGSLQRRYTIDTGGDLDISSLGLTEGVNQGVLGLPYSATWVSSKLAYAAEMGTALGQVKRVPQASLILYKTHQSGIQYGARDTGNLDALPRIINGKVIDQDTVHETLDQVAVPVPGTYETDPRLIIRASSPRACTVLAVCPTVVTSEK